MNKDFRARACVHLPPIICDITVAVLIVICAGDKNLALKTLFSEKIYNMERVFDHKPHRDKAGSVLTRHWVTAIDRNLIN